MVTWHELQKQRVSSNRTWSLLQTWRFINGNSDTFYESQTFFSWFVFRIGWDDVHGGCRMIATSFLFAVTWTERKGQPLIRVYFNIECEARVYVVQFMNLFGVVPYLVPSDYVSLTNWQRLYWQCVCPCSWKWLSLVPCFYLTHWVGWIYGSVYLETLKYVNTIRPKNYLYPLNDRIIVVLCGGVV